MRQDTINRLKADVEHIDNKAQQAFARFALSASETPVPEYFTEHGDECDDRDGTFGGLAIGYSIYRALARLLIGDASDWPLIRDAVLHFALTVYSNRSHPLHARYKIYEHDVPADTRYELFALLDCPDFQPFAGVFWVIAHALDVRICIHDNLIGVTSDRYPPTEYGSENKRRVHLVKERIDVAPKAFWNFSSKMVFRSLMPDSSGKDIVYYLLFQHHKFCLNFDGKVFPSSREHLPSLEQVSWTWTSTRSSQAAEDVKCYNGFRDENEPKALKSMTTPNRMDTFLMVVDEPRQIRFALETFKRALSKAPNQFHDVRVSKECSPGTLLPFCSLDVEFLRLPRELVAGKSSCQVTRMIERGEVDEICSVLTIGIGKHLSIMFYLAHMLEHATEETVPAIEEIFQATIFNAKLLKLWWNPQSDFRVLETTMAYMYQATVSPVARLAHPDQHCLPKPTFHIRSQHLNSIRPDWMRFRQSDQECDLHARGRNEMGMSCPCYLSNIDLAALLNHICRQQGISMPKVPWTQVRAHFNYGSLLECTLRGHRLLPILRWMKSCHMESGMSLVSFFQGQGEPGMEKNGLYVAYNAVDVLGLNLLMEQLLGAEDKQLMARILIDYSHGKVCSGPSERVVPQGPTSSKGFVHRDNPVSFFDDSPRVFIRKPFDATELPPDAPRITTDASLFRTGTLHFWEHEERLQMSRKLLADGLVGKAVFQKPIYQMPSRAECEWQKSLKDELLKQLTDPTRFWVPETCAVMLEKDRSGLIVRAGTSHAEALIDFLKSPNAAGLSPPRTFGYKHQLLHPRRRTFSESLGDIVPGARTPAARNILDAFQDHDDKLVVGEGLGEPLELPKPPKRMSSNTISTKARAENMIMMKRSRGVPNPEYEVRAELVQQVSEEFRLNLQEGLPSTTDFRDVWDPDGREYRKMVEAAPAWNKPAMEVPQTRPNGAWMSVATETLAAVSRIIEQMEKRQHKRRL